MKTFPNTYVGRRNRLLVILLLDTGLRISEALGLRIENVDTERQLIEVMGKGNKDRLVPFGENLKHLLQKWIEENGLYYDDYLFIAERTRQVITTACVRFQLRKYGVEAGIKGTSVRPHIFRHTFAVMFLRNGGNPFVLQRIMGHSTLDMTRRYVNLLIEDLQREHHLYGPGDRLSFLRN